MKPKVGMVVIVRGMKCTIRRVRPFGTLDVESESGQWFRVSGLAFP